MTDQQNRSGGNGRYQAIMWLAIAIAVVLLVPLRQSDLTVTLYGFEMAVWLVAALFYVIGLAAGWAAFMARRR